MEASKAAKCDAHFKICSVLAIHVWSINQMCLFILFLDEDMCLYRHLFDSDCHHDAWLCLLMQAFSFPSISIYAILKYSLRPPFNFIGDKYSFW